MAGWHWLLEDIKQFLNTSNKWMVEEQLHKNICMAKRTKLYRKGWLIGQIQHRFGRSPNYKHKRIILSRCNEELEYQILPLPRRKSRDYSSVHYAGVLFVLVFTVNHSSCPIDTFDAFRDKQLRIVINFKCETKKGMQITTLPQRRGRRMRRIFRELSPNMESHCS